MSLLTIELLGHPRISLAGLPLDVRVRKELALLAYLAVEQEHRHSRESVLGLFWPDVPEEAARNNLRVVHAGLRRRLGAASGQFLLAERQHMQFLPGSDHALDVISFRRLLAGVGTHAHAALDRCDTCLAQLAEAAGLYQGDFLAGFGLPDSAPFEEWATIQREQLHQQQLTALDTLATAYELRGDYSAQVGYGRRQLALEPWHETAHAQVIRGLWATGQRGAALEQYEACRRILADELGLEPTPELAALADQLRTASSSELRVLSFESPAPQLKTQNSELTIQNSHNLPAQLTSFIGRAAQLADLPLDAANLPAILRVCQLVQGMPLGLELAAAWVEALTPAEIADEIARSADFLTSKRRDLPERQRSVRAVFEMTWQRLRGEERTCFAQLAVFRGGFTREAAHAVAGASVGTLSRLVQMALVRASESGSGEKRYELHELLRQLAEAALAAAPGGVASARQRHAAFFTALAQEAEPQLEAADQLAWLDRLEAEHDNIRAALGWAVAGGDRRLGLRLAAALGEFWWPRGHLSEGRRWLDLLLAGHNLPDQPTVAKALAGAGELAYGQGDHQRAAALLQQSLERYRQLADQRGQARALRGLSNLLAARDDQQPAVALRSESLALFRATGDQLGVAWMLLETGRSEPNPARQLALLEESLALSRAGGYPRTIATALGNLGKLARDHGEHERARRHLHEALEIGRRLRDGWLCAWMLDELGVLATYQGDWRQARSFLEQSMAIFRQNGNQRGVALVATHLALTPGDAEAPPLALSRSA